MQCSAIHSAGQINPGGDIAPLIRARHLQFAVVAPVELNKVVRLEQLVGELGERHPGVPVDARPHRVPRQHGADIDVLAHVAEEVEQGERPGPVVVVHQRPLGDHVDKATHLIPDGRHVGRERRLIEQRSLVVASGRVSDASGRTTHQHQRPMTGTGKTGQQHQLLQVAGVQGRRRGVKAAIQGDRPLGQAMSQSIQVRAVADQAAGGEVVQQRGLLAPRAVSGLQPTASPGPSSSGVMSGASVAMTWERSDLRTRTPAIWGTRPTLSRVHGVRGAGPAE